MLAIGLIVFVSLAGLLPKVSEAALDTPQILSYQGRLTDAQKVTVPDGARAMAFIIYDAATLGNCEWTAAGTCGTPTTVSVTVTDGLFNVMLGASPQIALPDALFNTTEERWLEVRIDGETLTPRRRIVSSATALQAGNASLLDSFDTSQVGGAVAFVPVTDSSGNLVLTQNLTVDTTTLFVDSSANRVGVGTATPGVALDVSGTNIRLRNAAGGSALVVSGSAGTESALLLRSLDTASWTILRDGADADKLKFRYSETPGLNEFMTMTTTGNVGIGTTSPDFKLQIDGDIVPETDDTRDLGKSLLRWRDLYLGPGSLNIGTNGNDYRVSYDTAGVGTLVFNDNGDDTDIRMESDTDDDLFFVDASANNIGVSTITPLAKLHVDAGAAASIAMIVRGAASQSANLTEWRDSTNAILTRVDSSGNVVTGLDYLAASASAPSTTTEFNDITGETNAPQVHSVTLVPSDGLPILAYMASNNSLKARKCSTANCSSFAAAITLDTLGSGAGNLSGVLASDGFPFFAYRDSGQDLKVAHCTDISCSSVNTTVIATGTNIGNNTAVATRSDGSISIVYYSGDANDIFYLLCSNPTAATPCSTSSTPVNMSTTDGSSVHDPDVEMSTDGFPIVFFGNGFGNVTAVKCADADCTLGTQTVTVVGGYGTPLDADRLPGGNTILVATGGSTVNYIKCTNASCSTSSSLTLTDLTFGSCRSHDLDLVVRSGLPIIYDNHDGSSCGQGDEVARIYQCGNDACSSGNSTTVIDTGTTAYDTGGTPGGSFALNATGDLILQLFGDAGGPLRVARVLLSSVVFTGTDIGTALVPLANAFFGGDVTMRRALTSEFTQVGTQSSDPSSATNGAMYYSTATSKFRCYENATWKDCVSNPSPTVITSDGSNIGINTTVYSAKLNVADSTASDATAELMTLRRLRSDATAPGAADFGSDLTYRLEGFTNNSDVNAVRIRGAWEAAQTDDTTARDSYLSFSTMLNDTLAERARFTSAGNFVPGLDNTYDLGTSALRWKTLHLGPGSLVVHNDATDTNKISVNFSGATGQLVTDSATPLKITTGVNVGINMTTAGNVGIGTATPTVPLAFDGNTSVTIGQERSTSGAGGALTIRSASAQSGGSNLAGGSLILAGGTSTGSGASSIQFQTATAGASGTADRAPTTKATLSGAGDFTLSGDYLAAAAGSGSSTTEVNTISDAAMNLVRAVTLVPSDNEPVHAWINGSNLFIRKCNDVNCAAATSSATLDTTVSGTTSLSGIIGSDGNPFFVYRDNTGAIRVARCTDVNCSSSVNNTVTAATSSDTNSNVTTSAVLMPDNSVAIVYVTAVSGSESDTYYFRCTNPLHGTTPCSTTSPVSPQNMSSSYAAHAQTPMVQVSSDNMPIVFWWGRVNFDDAIRAVKCGDTDCTLGSQTSTTLVGPDEQKGIFSTARLPSGLAVITSSMAGTSQGCGGIQPRIYYTKCTNASCSTYSNVTLYQGVASQCVVPNSAVRIQTSGLPIIAYTDGNNNASFVTCNDDSCTTTSSVSSFTPAPTATGGVTMAINPDGDAIVRYGNNGSTNYVARILLSSVVYTGTDIGSVSSRLANAYFGGELKTGSLTIDGTSPNGFLSVNGTTTLGDGSGSDKLTVNMGDSITDALDIQQGSNNYININTTNSSENISFGNVTTNPTFTYLGSGDVSIGGAITPVARLQIEETTSSNAALETLTVRRSRSDATAPGAADFGADIGVRLEGFTDASDVLATRIRGAWETAQTDDTTSRDSYLSFATMANNTLAERMRIDSAGNVGIGTTTPDNAFDVVGTIDSTGFIRSTDAAGVPGTGTGIELVYPTGAPWSGTGIVDVINRSTDAMRPLTLNASDITFRTSTTGATSFSQPRMTIDASGNVGIGTMSPAGLLDVEKNQSAATIVRLANTTSAATSQVFERFVTSDHSMFVGATSAAYTPLFNWDRASGAYVQTDGIGGLSLTARDAAGIMTFSTGGDTERMRIDSAGNVGIGATNPLGMLDISKDGAAAIQYIWAYGSGGSTYPLMELLRSRGTRASPSPALSGDTLGAFAIGGQYNTTFGNANGSAVIVATATETFTASANGTSLDFQTSTTGTAVPASRLFIDGSGNVGIGDTTPTDARLDIDAGTVATGTNALNVSGTLPASGSTQIGNRFDTTTSSGGTGAVIGMFTPITGAYTGADNTISIYGHNDVAGTATFDPVAFNSSTMSGNLAVLGLATGVTAGTNVGSRGIARSGSGTNIGVQGSVDVGAAVGVNSLNYGVTGVANAAHNGGSTTQRHIGVGGFAVSGDFNVGGYFGLNAAAPTYDATAALIADNAAIAAPIFLARDNGTAVLTIADGGALSTTSTTTLGDDTGADTLTVNTGTSNVDIDTRKVSGTLLNLAYGAATTLTGATTGQLINLSTNVTADDQSITGLQVNLPTQSITALSRTIRGLMVNGAPITTATSGTTTADMIFVSGSDINEGAGTNLSTSGVHVVTRSISGGGTQRGFYVTVGSPPASGNHVAFEAGPTTSAGATNTAYLVDTGWDHDLRFLDDTPTMTFTDGARMSWSDTVNELALFSDLSTNFGLAVDAGAFMSRNSAVADEFNVERADLTADTAGAGGNGFGDAQAWGVYESTASGCTFSTLDDAVNGIFRLDPGATTAGCMTMLDSAANNRHDILDADNLPLLLMKAKPTTVGADNVVYLGMSDDTDGTTVAPNDFIGFSNDDGTPDGNWYGVARSGGTQSTTASCGAASTTQFALMKVEVRTPTDVHFFIDTDVSNGVSWSECGTGLTTNIPTTALAPQIHYQSRATTAGTFDVDFFRAWQDDAKDQVANYVSKQHKATDTENRVALAQLVPAKNLDLVPGTLVAMDPLAAIMGAEPTKIAHDPYLLGVVVKDASLVLGNGTFDGVKVATSGRVSVKVSDANGSIKKGDWLTSSTIPGIAMKATQQGSILGYALQNADAASDTVMIQLQVQSGFPVNGASQLASNTTQDFKIYGDVDFANYSITNIRAIRGMNWSIGEDGALVVSKVTTGEIVIKQSPEKQTIGSGEVPAEHTHVTISNPSVHTSSKIFISWRGIPGWIVDQAEGSFTVQLLNAIQMPTKFDYWVVQVDGEVLVQTTPTAPAAPTEPTQPAETTQPTEPATTTVPTEPAEPMSPPPLPDPTPIPEPTPEPPTEPDPTPEPAPEPPTIPAEQTPE